MNNRTVAKMVCIAIQACVLAVASSPAQTFTTLASFTGTDGGYPLGTLIQATDGQLYGTTSTGGANGSGTIFSCTLGGSLTPLYGFSATYNGSGPEGGLIQATDGNFYGTTYSAGVNDTGTVFQFAAGGAFVTLHTFSSTTNSENADGANPVAPLVQGNSGVLYGTTSQGGPAAGGTVFTITPDGAFTMLFNFGSASDGFVPIEALVQATSGIFYGETFYGGPKTKDWGTVFTMTPSGVLTALHSFDKAEGIEPDSPLVQATGGDFYGTTGAFGPKRNGTVFKLTARGALTTVHSFDGADGSGPASLIQATDGNFYGTTGPDGAKEISTLFQMTPAGAVTTLHRFEAEIIPNGLVQATDGNFYGTTYNGGSGGGTVFKVSMGLSPFVATRPASGTVGSTVTILGMDLTGATSVTFNATPAAFTVVSPSEITTTVPAGASTGSVLVTTPGGGLLSNVAFTVRP